jgi:hypothetical protein
MNKITSSANVASLLFVFAMCVAGSAFAGGNNFSATLSGAQELPEVVTPATGKIKAKFDKGFTEVTVDLEIKNLVGSLTGAHLHCARPAVNGPVVIGLISPGPLSFDGKRIRGTLTNADFTGAVCSVPVTNIVALAFAMQNGLIYVNVHSDFSPTGEIRGQMQK